MKSVGFVDMVGFVVEKSGIFPTERKCMIPSRLMLRGGEANTEVACRKFAARPCAYFSRPSANSSSSSPGRVKLHHSNRVAVGFVETETLCLKKGLFRLRREDLEHHLGNSDSRFRRSIGGNYSSDCRAARVFRPRSCVTVAGESCPLAGEKFQKNQFEGGLYRPFADFVVRELGRRSDVSSFLLKDEFRNMVARDGSTAIENEAFESSKIRYFRSTYINAGSSMQVLNVAGFSRPEYDIPIFCADFFSTATRNIIVLDLNPLYSTSTNKSYKERYYDNLLALANKHVEVLTWGDKLTAESVQFFSPLVLWTKAEGQDLQQTLYPAFQDYLLAWLSILDESEPASDPVAVARNREAQHRYLTWRATKDPGRTLLTRLYGEEFAERYIEEYLFQGVKTLGTKSFLDYFPEYRTEDNTISKQRSIIGKSFSSRPWDEHGNFLLDSST